MRLYRCQWTVAVEIEAASRSEAQAAFDKMINSLGNEPAGRMDDSQVNWSRHAVRKGVFEVDGSETDIFGFEEAVPQNVATQQP